ncbi:MAG: YfcE family phosphodiesterase [Phycisphaerae bacterium]|nr:YfcE family phosphodiesterase [Phycisphaerae bacterium]MDW8261488.1 YfcE family phosphodiesterase [Phycisphaerales bacterium]
MLLGILSDSHNQLDITRLAIETLQRAGAEFFIHCGDVGEERVLDLLSGLPNAVVWGNNDFDRQRLARYAQSISVNVHDPVARLTLAGRHLLVTHGDDPRLIESAVRDRSADYILFGHSHIPSDQRRNGVRLINPGALHRARPKTVATLDLLRDELRHIELKR